MYEVLKAGGMAHGGLNFDAKSRRPSNTMEDLVESYILGMDSFALGLIKAAAIIEDGRLDEFVKNRYASFSDGIGAKVRRGETSLTELSDYACSLKKPENPSSGKQESLQGIVNAVMFG